MAGMISQNAFDIPGTIVVPVIASFNSHGRIVPLYVRIYGASYKISSSHMLSNFLHTMEFTCHLIDGESIKPLLLTFHKQEGMWTIRI